MHLKTSIILYLFSAAAAENLQEKTTITKIPEEDEATSRTKITNFFLKEGEQEAAAVSLRRRIRHVSDRKNLEEVIN